MKFVMDTDHISILQHQSGSEFTALSRRIVEDSSEDLAFTIVSLHEQAVGSHNYINRARTRDGIIRGYSMLESILRTYSLAPVLPFDSDALDWFDRLSTQRLRVATMDLRIASIALSRGLILLTRNVSDFGKVPGLSTEDWTR
jgi:tRNA(fMet)-specific endonuclease VapC